MPKTKGKLTPKQRRFCTEYLLDLNATQAAIRAGYSIKSADRIGPDLIGKTCVAECIAELMRAREASTAITAERVVAELAKIAFGDRRRIMTWGPNGVTLKSSDDLSSDDAATVAEVSETTSESGGSLRVKLHDKVKALELLGRHLGMFIDKRELTGKDGGPIKIENSDEEIEREIAKLTGV